jgi:hypothetical protein
MREHHFATTPTGRIVTRTGIIIGGCHSRTIPQSRDAELIQAMLLNRRTPTLLDRALHLFDTAPGPVLAAILIGGLAWGVAHKVAS